ncbi:MAG: UDP-N-acetylglucosamine 2-epimerase (non-hydrolyzing) [Nitrospira sp.]|nr:UDP-N-acetylglucosamine 2-epimerase (non-hydrolyzing) [Nitrospira sp.]
MGTRPEAIKLAPVVWAMRKCPQAFKVKICSTGQHRHMLDQALSEFNLTPDIELAVMRPAQSLAALSAQLYDAVDQVLEKEAPDWVMVQGDTTTVMVAGLCAFYRGVKLAHVEAGLRTYDRSAPFPEEVNRRIVTLVADLHFAPTGIARDNLLREGVAARNVVVTGNTVVDALRLMKAELAQSPPPLPASVEEGIRLHKKIVLVTGHRRENFGQGLKSLCLAIKELAMKHPLALFVYPVHLNPSVRTPVHKMLRSVKGVILTEPLSYKPFLYLMQHSYLVLTDSGGIQEESASLGKPVLVTRDVTERPEGVLAGVSRLVGTSRQRIVMEVSRLLTRQSAYVRMSRKTPEYGNGRASEKIVRSLMAWPAKSARPARPRRSTP